MPLALPAPIDLPAFANHRQVGDAIRAALARSRWRVLASSGESITAECGSGVHTLRVRIDYGAGRLVLRYVDSAQLGYAEHQGERFIQADANRWLALLRDELRDHVQRLDLENPPVEVVPVLPGSQPVDHPDQ